MKNFLNKMKYGWIRFFSGRYGWDSLGAFLLTCALIVDLVSIFANVSWLAWIAEILMLYVIIRMFSRNIPARRKENDWFRNRTKKIRHFFSALRKGRSDKANRYYVCPECGQIIRIPRGHGKVEIHCPKCSHVFTRKS